MPTIGLLVTSVRNPAARSPTSGWWTSLLNPFARGPVDADQLPAGAQQRGHGQRLPQQPDRDNSLDGHPDHDRGVRRLRVRLDPVPRPGILFTIVVALLVVPIQMSLIPILKIYSGAGLYGTFLGIWLAHTGFGLPLAIFLLYNFISQLPRDLFESAAIDGASHLQTFIRIVLPLSMPALGAFAIFQFLWVWNDLLVALTFLGVD